jgi:hypothetical protein
MSFNDLEYTRRKLVQHLGQIQEHASDGSALENCKCIEEKHLIMVSGNAAEGVSMATDQHEKDFYAWLSPWADKTLDNVLHTLDMNDLDLEKQMWATLADDTREIRHSITDGSYDVPNPASKRAYLPHGLTQKEKIDSELREKLSRCINKVEQKCCKGHSTILYDEEGHADYAQCSCNPVAVCRSSVGTGNPKRLSSKEFQQLYDTLRSGVKHPEVKYTAPPEEVEPFILEFKHKAAREK